MTTVAFDRDDDIIRLDEAAGRYRDLLYLRDDEEDYELDSDEEDDLNWLESLNQHINLSAAEVDGTLISDNHWNEYAADSLDEIHGIPEGLKGYIDYDSYADDLRTDYTTIEVESETFYTTDAEPYR